MKLSQPIGIFDSGVGGLTVAKAIAELLPHEEIIYVGDTEHMPYGDKSEEHIKAYCKRIVEFLLTQHVKLIVIACNTASAIAASYLRSLFWEQVEIIGVIRPAIKNIIEKQVKQVGIIGTQGTIQSNIYVHLFKEYQSKVDIFQLATPLLAPMIEAGNTADQVSDMILDGYLKNEGFQSCDAILLACTHYPIIKNKIVEYFHHEKLILDNAQPAAEEVKQFLIKQSWLNTNAQPQHRFYVTDYTNNFEKIAALFYGKQVRISKLDIHPTL